MAKSRIIDLIEGKEKSVVPSDYLMQGQRFYTPPGGEEVNTYDKGLGRSSIDLQQQLRNSNQTGADMAASAAGRLLQVPFSVIGNVASALDFEDYVNQDQEVGNWLTTAMDNIKTDIRDANPIYRRSDKPLDIGDPAWWWDNGSSLVESATAFVATGYLTGGGLGALGKGANSLKWLKTLGKTGKSFGELRSAVKRTEGVIEGMQWLANSAALNQAESIGIATNVYDSVLREKLQAGLTENEAMQAAADAASTSINVNRINILLNLTSAKAFIRPPQMTRQILEKAGGKQLMKTAFGHEGIQEAAEETINMFAENKARAEAAGKKYGLTEAMNDMLSAQGLENAILGFAGGAGQTLLTGAAKALPTNKIVGADGKVTYMSDNAIHNQKYEAQQKVIAQQNQIANINGFRGLTDVFESVDKQQQLLSEFNLLSATGNKEAIDKASNNLLIFQAQKAFESGTTESLIETYNKLGNLTDEQYQAQGLEPEYARQKVKEAVRFIEDLEVDYIDATNYKNPEQVYNVAANLRFQEKKQNEFQQDLNIKKAKLNDRIQAGLKAGTYSTKSELYKKIEGSATDKIEVPFTFDVDAVLSDDKIYTGKAASNWNKATFGIKKTKEYRAAKEAKDKVDAVEQGIEYIRQQYDEVTSPEFQNSLTKQEQFVEKVKELDKKYPKKDKEYVKEFEDLANEAGIAKEMAKVATKVVKENVKSQHVADKAELAEQPVTQPQSIDDLFGFDESDFIKGLMQQQTVQEKPNDETQYEDDLDKVFSEENEKRAKAIEEQKQKAVAEAINPDVTDEFTEKSIVEEQPKDDTVNPYQDASRLMFLNIPYTKTNDEILDGTDKVDYKYNINPDNLLPGTKIYVQLAPHPDEASRVNDETRPYQTKYMEVRTVDGDVLIGGLTNESHYEISGEIDKAKRAEIERRRQEELNQQTDAGYSIIALDYLFTGGRDVMLSTDYLLQALVGGFTHSAKEINDIRNKYADKLGNIKDDINSDIYNQMMSEIRNVINKNYNNSKATEIFDKILKNATGFISREGNQVNSELDKLNEQNESKINAKYDAELAALPKGSNKVFYTNSSGTYKREIPITPAQATEQLEQLNNFRKQVFENGKVETTIDFKGYGAFNTNKGKKPQNTVAKYQPTASIAYVGAEGKLFDGLELHPLFKNGQVMNANKIASENHSGQTYSIVQLRGKEFVALPVWHKKLSETDMGNRIQDNIIRTVDKFISLEEGKRDVNVLINHIRQFINWRGDAGNKNKYTKVNYQFNVIAKDNAIIISRADGKPIVDKVPYIRISNDMKVQEQTKQLILNTLKEVLAESYTATSAKHLDNNKQVKLGDDTWSYKDFVKEITFTNVEGIEVEEGKYAYTVQPYINIDMKNVAVSIAPVQTATDNRTIEIYNLVVTEDNYNKWSNVRDKSDWDTFKEQAESAIKNILSVENSKYTRELLDDYFKNIKVFQSKALRNKVIDILIKPISKPIEVIKIETKVIDQPKVQSVLERFKNADTRFSPSVIIEATNQINYTLKIIDALNKIPRNKFESSKLQGWLNDLQKQGVSNQQIEIFKEYAKDGMTKEEIIASISADLSFVVESNIATENRLQTFYDSETGEYYGGDVKTDYYTRLTVPGGTNYTENEISTPLITPSIKGHAQFSTDNGIGWFRSDDKSVDELKGNWIKTESELPNEFVYNGEKYFKQDGEWQTKSKFIEDIEIVIWRYNMSLGNKRIQNKSNEKTRRILEVQSDLFQKGRGKNDLTEGERKDFGHEYLSSNEVINFIKEIDNPTYLNPENNYNNSPINKDKLSIEDIKDGKYSHVRDNNKGISLYWQPEHKQYYFHYDNPKLIEYKSNTKGNQFLQLLNKDNNWVTFFIKSIIQDSAKKGYEKVLFPTGNTASKVEGHSTLEQFKKEKEDRIKELENKVQIIKKGGYLGSLNSVQQYDEFGEYTQYLDQDSQGEFEEITKEEYDKRFKKYSNQELEKVNDEINQLKQELERVEREGFGALRPIYNFYENTVANILKKNYKGSVKEVTDEYGNSWNEIGLSNLKNELILLSPATLSQAEVDAQILQRDANDPDFVEGLTADKVNDVVYYLINRFAQALDSGEGEPNSILDEVQKSIESDKETLEEVVKEDSGYQKHLDSLNAVLNGWNKIATISQKRFGSLYKFTFDDEYENDEDVAEETWDKASFEKNDKLRVGTELKLFLSGILDIDSQGKKYNFIGQDKYIHWEVAYESLKNILTNAPHDYNKIIEILKVEVQNKPWVQGVVDKLATANDKILTQFVSRMPGHALNMVYVSFASNKKGTTLRTHRTNTSAAKDIVFNTWSNQMRRNLYNLDRGTGTYTFDKELADELIEEYKSWENPEPQAVRTWLEMVGITFNDVAWSNIVRNGYTHNKQKIAWSDLFGKYKNFQQSNPSFLAQIANGLQRAKNTEVLDDEINDLDNNDTPITDSVIAKTLARIEASTSNELRPNSFRDGDKQLYSYILEQKSIDRLNWLMDDAEKSLAGEEQDYSLLKQLLSTAFAKDSSWLNSLQADTEKGKHFREVFDINHLSITALKELGKRYGGDRKIVNLDDAEHELVKVGLFQDKSQGTSKYGRTARFFFPTLSDKSQMLMVSTLTEDFGTADSKYINGEGQITDEGYSYLYKLLIKPEVDRIHEFNKFGKNINIAGYNQGADKFIMFPEMNNVKIEDKKVVDILDTYGEETPQLVFDKIESVLTQQLKHVISSIVQDKINEWEQLGINELLDIKYLADMVGDKNKTAAQDFVVNYLISNAESFKTFIGDPAQYWKTDFFGTDTNITKRLAAILAPGTKLANSDAAVYTQLFLDDTKIPSVAITELQELLGSEANVYTGIEGTDAQEFTTVLEEFYIAKNNGEITGDLFDVVSAIIITELQKGNHDYLQAVADAIEGTELEDEYNDFLFQPRKPVYTGDYYQSGDHPVMRDMYIKSSSFPLQPNMTKGKEIDKLRIAMEKLELQTLVFKNGSVDGGTVRASFKSANKVGAPAVNLPAMDKTGNFYDYDTEVLKAHSLTLARRNFRIQQEVPFKGEKEEINRGTQESKTFFTNLLNVNGFKWNDKTVKGYELYKEYESRMTRIFEIQKQNLLDEIGVESFEEVSDLLGPNNKNIERKKQVLNTIVEILRTEALDRNYPKKDILALQVTESGELKQPLWLAASHFRYENLLSALVKQRVLKMGMPGAPFVLGTEEGFKNKTVVQEEVPESNEIVHTDKWTGKLKPAIQNNGFAQVLISSRFNDKNGNLVDIKKFAKQVDGKWILDNDKVDQDLLKIFGFRIPTSGLMSMSGIEIVGFLPATMGDLIIAPRDFTKQMGSDFDIDKLYTYMKYHSVGETITIDNSTEAKKLKNEIIDIHHSVMGNNSKVVKEQILKPLSTKHIEDQAALVDSLVTKRKYRTLLNDTWQKDKLMQLASGKIGTGTTSLDVTFHSIAQVADAAGSPLTLMNKNKAPLVITIDGKTSNGNLGGERTLDGSDYISVANSEMQNASVDNATVQALGKLNINNYTFSAERMLRLLGFDKGNDGNNIRYMLLSQPIIKDFVQALQKQQSGLSDYDANFEQNIINELLKKYETTSNVSLKYKNNITDDFSKRTASITTSKLVEALTGYSKIVEFKPELPTQIDGGEFIQPTQEETNKAFNTAFKESEATYKARVAAFNELQGAALDLFLVADYYGREIAKVEGLLNVDSKGFGKSIPEIIEAVNNAQKILQGTTINNVSELIGTIYTNNSKEWDVIKDTELAKEFIAIDNLRIKPANIPGAALTYGLGSAYNMWKNLFPYQQTAFEGVVKNIHVNSKIDAEASATKLAELKTQILSEFKKALYSDVIAAGLSTEDVTTNRKKLFIDTEDNQSLASYLDTIKPLMNNSFINRLETHIVNTGLPSRISYNNAAGEDIDENLIYDAAFSLFASDAQLPDYNGEAMTVRKLLQYLTLYAYAGDPIQQATQFIKFIPYELLEASGTNQYARDIHNRVMSNDLDLYRGFEKQYFQHNPTKITQIPFNSLEKLTGIKGKNIVLANEFTATSSFVEEYGEVKYVAYYIQNLNTVNKKNRWKLFELGADGKYRSMPVLGVFGMNEYQLGQENIGSIVNGISVNTQTDVPLQENQSMQINFQEEQTSGYRNRTIKNASADATIAIAVDFNSAGEKLTKSSVEKQGKKYIGVNANSLEVTPERVNALVEALNKVSAKTLNIAGNGIYTMKGKYTQQQVDDFTFNLLNAALNSPNLKNKIVSIRTGGQTGFDESGAKAGIRLGIPTMILAPKGWTFRNIKGQDISSEKLFKERFGEIPVQHVGQLNLFNQPVISAQQVIPDVKTETLYNPVHGGSLQELVMQIETKSSNPMFKELAGYLKDKISNEKISVKNLGINGGRIDNGHISVSNQFTSNEEFERVLLHEVVHLLTLQKLQDKGNIDIKNNLIKLKTQARKVIADKYGITTVQEAAEHFKKDKTLTSEQRKAFYGILTIPEDASGVDEFVTQIMTEPEFQKLLGETKAEGFDHSMLQRFFNLIKRLLIRTGILPESITAQAINQVLTLIEGNVQPEVIRTNTTVYNYNPTNVSEKTREEYKKYVLDNLGTPEIKYIESGNDKLYRFTFKDNLVIETPAKGQMLSIPKVTDKLLALSQKDASYDIKVLIGLNKIAEGSSKTQTISSDFMAGLKTETTKTDIPSGDFMAGLKSPATTFEDFKKQLKKTCN